MKRHDIVWLHVHGFQGLWNPEGPCGCALDDYAPCGDGPFRECVPAVQKDDGLFYPAPKWRQAAKRIDEAQAPASKKG